MSRTSCRFSFDNKLFRKCFYWGLVVCLFTYFLLTFFNYNYGKAWNLTPCELLSEDQKFIINTNTCQIPNFKVWDPEINHFYNVSTDPKCKEKVPNWSYIIHLENELNFNETAMQADGKYFQDVSCCYMNISRTSNSTLRPDFDVDFSQCKKIISPKTKIHSEFIVVECVPVEKKNIIYRMFHALVQEVSVNKRKLPNKMSPNIVILGLDSTSRLNMWRHMNKTISVLQSLNAVEMLGYNKAGYGTFSNFNPLLAGLDTKYLMPLCGHPNTTYYDKCPFIWKQFEDAGYLSSYLEDGNTYTYKKDGWNKQPSDFYMRPLFLASFNYDKPLGERNPVGNHMRKCIGYQQNTQMNLDYVEATLDYARKRERPLFSFFWDGILAHDDTTGIKWADGLLEKFLKRLLLKGHLENTILLVMGDHGYRYGDVRGTNMGAYEDKLPALWIFLPLSIRNLKPNWVEALNHNRHQLTSPYAVYWAFRSILKELGGMNSEPEDVKSLDDKRSQKYNLFEPITANVSCTDLGIPEPYCACHPPKPLALNDSIVVKSSNFAINHVNKFIIDQNKCEKLKVSSITKASIRIKSANMFVYLTTFSTKPGGGVFEAEVTYNKQSKSKFNKDTISIERVNKMNMDYVKCIQDDKIELFCYCK